MILLKGGKDGKKVKDLPLWESDMKILYLALGRSVSESGEDGR